MRRVGILGAGQLGSLLAHALQDLGADVASYDPDPLAPAHRRVAEGRTGGWKDAGKLQRFFDGCDAVTYEFENVETEGLEKVHGLGKLRPSIEVLKTCQDRIREKEFFREAGIPHVEFRTGRTVAILERTARSFGFPSILKTARGGYDGKGQWRLSGEEDLAALLAGPEAGALESSGWVLEEPIAIEREVSAIVAREPSGREVVFPLFENEHRDHILDLTLVPARVDEETAAAVVAAARAAVDRMGVTGLLTVEFFVGTSGRDPKPVRRVFANEMAPRPHNSGHVTRKACTLSQYDALARVLAGVPLAEPALVSGGSFCMANLLGDVWEAQGGEDLDLTAWAGFPAVREVVLYGKRDAKPRRKMGHLVAWGADAETAMAAARGLRDALRRPAGPPGRRSL